MKKVAASASAALVSQSLERLADLPKAREEISALKKTGAQTAVYYTETITVLLKSVAAISVQDVDPAVSRKMTSLFALTKGKEWAGQERAFITGIFVADAMSTVEYQAFLKPLRE